ncbi:uncharacterized protein LOC110737457 [Chenopodium quinoa]|uniref:uncharacterized protein LOC110737457 n=1 Tax=Chenopodium quinoa TaxID=63459 RepID=UPI000B779B05|nr:uncharacterized protein LOC110737457 [Chenopodium quinoa]
MLEDIDGGLFSILADESADVSDKEQLALCLRYVNIKGEVCECLLGIVHVVNTASLTLKFATESLLMEHSLSFSQVRGQGYDGASNMQVALAKKNSDCAWLFVDVLAPLLNFVGGSPKRKEFLRENQAQRVVDALSLGELETVSGLNQERGLGRPCDTRWGSHFKTILNVLDLFPVILGSVEDIAKVSDTIDSNRAQTLTNLLMSFDFVFVAHLMVSIFAITNALNVALQKHDQDIVNAMAMVNVTKTNLQKMRDEGWDSHMEQVISFIGDYDIAVPDMEAKYVVPGRRLFRVFFGVIDLQLQELENRFPEITKELLVCMSCLSLVDRFSKFDKEKLIKLAKFYPNEFPSSELIVFGHTLETYICSVRGDERFWNLKGLSELSIKLVETGLSETHDRVYLLLKLVLLLPVATTSVERFEYGSGQEGGDGGYFGRSLCGAARQVPVGSLKINVDAAIFGELGSGLGVIILFVTMKAIVLGLQIAIQCDVENVIIESDCLHVINKLKSREVDGSYLVGKFFVNMDYALLRSIVPKDIFTMVVCIMNTI